MTSISPAADVLNDMLTPARRALVSAPPANLEALADLLGADAGAAAEPKRATLRSPGLPGGEVTVNTPSAASLAAAVVGLIERETRIDIPDGLEDGEVSEEDLAELGRRFGGYVGGHVGGVPGALLGAALNARFDDGDDGLADDALRGAVGAGLVAGLGPAGVIADALLGDHLADIAENGIDAAVGAVGEFAGLAEQGLQGAAELAGQGIDAAAEFVDGVIDGIAETFGDADGFADGGDGAAGGDGASGPAENAGGRHSEADTAAD